MGVLSAKLPGEPTAMRDPVSQLPTATPHHSCPQTHLKLTICATHTRRSLKKIFSDRKLQGLVPQSRGFDRSSICLCCGTVLVVRFWCHGCRRLACCSAACLKALQDIHKPWCKGGRPIGPVGHASMAPRPSAVTLKAVADKLAVNGEQQHRTQSAITSLISLLKPKLLQLTAGYQRYAVGGSFAKLTAMQFKYDIDLVLLFGFESTTKANFASDHAELMDQVEAIFCRIEGMEVMGRSSKCIQCRWKSNQLDVLVGRSFGVFEHGNPFLKARMLEDLASTLLQLQDGYDADARSRLSPSFTECSVQFMSSQPVAVLRAIRVVKFWKHVSIAREISSCKTVLVRHASSLLLYSGKHALLHCSLLLHRCVWRTP